MAYDFDGRGQFGLSCRKSIRDARIDAKVLTVTWRRFDGLSSETGGAENMFCQLLLLMKLKTRFGWIVPPLRLIRVSRCSSTQCFGISYGGFSCLVTHREERDFHLWGVKEVLSGCTIRGKKREGMTAVECIRAAFSGGSMTGAPKLCSMEILNSIETCSRSIYSGSIGFFYINQTFDLNIVIRTVMIHNNEASVGAVAAVVSLSDPEAEYHEMVLKTQALVKPVMEFQ